MVNVIRNLDIAMILYVTVSRFVESELGIHHEYHMQNISWKSQKLLLV
jgi:hypothetical protein